MSQSPRADYIWSSLHPPDVRESPAGVLRFQLAASTGRWLRKLSRSPDLGHLQLTITQTPPERRAILSKPTFSAWHRASLRCTGQVRAELVDFLLEGGGPEPAAS